MYRASGVASDRLPLRAGQKSPEREVEKGEDHAADPPSSRPEATRHEYWHPSGSSGRRRAWTSGRASWRRAASCGAGSGTIRSAFQGVQSPLLGGAGGARRVEIRPSADLSARFPAEHGCPRCASHLSGGATLAAERSDYEGFLTLLMSWERAREKFERLAADRVEPERATELVRDSRRTRRARDAGPDHNFSRARARARRPKEQFDAQHRDRSRAPPHSCA